MSVEDRLLVLLTQAQQSGNTAVLTDPSTLRSQLSSQAPDLHGEIQALAAALAMRAPARIAAAADAGAERQAVATEIAQNERLSMGVVRPALDVACVAGLGASLTATPPPSNGWAGDSVIVGASPPLPPAYPPQPAMPYPGQPQAPQPYPQPGYPQPGFQAGMPEAPSQPFYKSTKFVSIAAAVIVLAAIGYSQSGLQQQGPVTPTPGPVGPTPGPVTPGPVNPPSGPNTGGEFATGGPDLAPYGGNLPTLTLQQGRAIGFNLTGTKGTVRGVVVLPAGGWDAGPGSVVANDGQAQSVGTGQFVRKDNNVPIRLMQVQWQQDGLQAGAVVIGFEGQQGQQDVALSGSVMCIMDGGTGQPVACGRVQGQ